MPNPEIPPERAVHSDRPLTIGPQIWDLLDSYDKNLKSKFIRAFRFISRDIGHPSLHLEVVKAGKEAFFRVHVDPKYRIHFELKDNYYLILAIGPHRLQGIG